MRYRRGESDTSEILEAISALGFEPRIAGDLPRSMDSEDGSPACSSLPEPIASSLTKANQAGLPLFLDFFAEWCAPCHTLEEKILPDPAVQAALSSFSFLRIDTDASVEATNCLEVFGLPTIIVLDSSGRELYRHEGLLSAEELASELERLEP